MTCCQQKGGSHIDGGAHIDPRLHPDHNCRLGPWFTPGEIRSCACGRRWKASRYPGGWEPNDRGSDV